LRTGVPALRPSLALWRTAASTQREDIGAEPGGGAGVPIATPED
jgi:hypothetical protein